MTDTPDDNLEAFEREIVEQEDLLYGIALVFEGISLVYAGQADVIETYRKQFRNVIQAGSQATQRARELLSDARGDARKRALIPQFAFHPGEGHADPAALVARARLLLQAYRELFPDRPRDRALTSAETLALMDAASLKLDA